MASIINITGDQPVYLTLPLIGSATSYQYDQPLTDAVDVSAFDFLDLELGVVSCNVPSASGSTVTIGLLTGMQNQTPDGWIGNDYPTATNYQMATFSASLAAPAYNIKSLGPFGGDSEDRNPILRYVRYSVHFAGGSGDSAVITFWIRGMARRLGTP